MPPISSLPSNIENDLFGQLFLRLYPAAIPEIPAPITITSLCIFSILILILYKSYLLLKYIYEVNSYINNNLLIAPPPKLDGIKL